jgi:hypothetical protein
LLGSSSVVTKISYRKGSVTYSTFDAESTDVLRLNFSPESVSANGRPLRQRKVLDQPGFVFDESTGVLRIRHDGAPDIDIQGKRAQETQEGAPPLYVTFDDPHLAAGTELSGSYPSGIIDWPRHECKIGVPSGKFGTFNLVPADPAARELQFSFPNPRVFVGVDVYNGGTSEASIAVHTDGAPDISMTLKPGELRRLRTGWSKASSRITIALTHGGGLRFDNLAYVHE